MTAESIAPETGTGGNDGSGPMHLLDLLLRHAGMLGGATIAVVAAALTVDVLLRWLAGAPTRGMFEMAEIGVAAGMALGMILASQSRSHVTMEMLGVLTGRSRGPNAVGSLVTLLVMGAYVWFTLEHAHSRSLYGETSYMLAIPMGPVWYAIAAILALAFVAQIGAVVQMFRNLQQGSSAAFGPGGTLRELRPSLLVIGAILLLALGGVFWSTSFSDGQIILFGFALLALCCFVHVPLGSAMAIVGLYGIWLVGGPAAMAMLGGNNVTSALSSVDLAAIPLFLLMGNLAISAGLADKIFTAARMIAGRFRGGLAMTAVLGSAGFGTICGSSVATTAMMGKVAAHEMLDEGYSPTLATGSIAAGGTLGALIPPSVVLIIYCLTAEVPIHKAFVAAIIPGAIAVILYLLTVMVVVRLRPSLAPAPTAPARFDPLACLGLAWQPGLMFLTIVGGLYGGVFTVQEAAAVGAGIALLFWLTSGRASLRGLAEVLSESVTTSASLYFLLIGANIFSAFLNMADLGAILMLAIDPAIMPAWMIIGVLVVAYLVLGSIFDEMAAMIVTLPVVIPLLVQIEVDLIWWGIVMLQLISVGMIAPPMGMNVFVMKAVIGNRVSMNTIYRGVLTFLVADLIRLSLLLAFPALALFLPGLM